MKRKSIARWIAAAAAWLLLAAGARADGGRTTVSLNGEWEFEQTE